MCHRVIYDFEGQQYTVSFKNPSAKLPILLRSGKLQLLPWGKREYNFGSFPVGSSVCLDDIKMGKFDAYFPKPVKVPIKAFLVSNHEGYFKWFHLPCDKWLQGMVIRQTKNIRLYLITLPPSYFSEYPNWPRVFVS